MRPTFTTLHVKTENSCEIVVLLYYIVCKLDEIKFSFTEFSFTDTLLRDTGTENVNELSSLMADRVLWKKLSRIRVPRDPA